MGALRYRGKGQGKLRGAVLAGSRIRQIGTRGDRPGVDEAESVARPGGKGLGIDLHPNPSGDGKIGGGSAVQEPGGNADRGLGLEGQRFGGLGPDLDARRHEVFHLHRALPDRGSSAGHAQHEAPVAGDRAAGEPVVVRHRARLVAPDGEFAGDHAVGADDGQLEGQAADRMAPIVANEGRQVNGLAGAVDPAIGIEIGVHRTGRRATADPAVGEIEAGPGQREERAVSVSGPCAEEHRLAPPGAAQEPGRKGGAAIPVGGALGQGVFVARQQGQGYPRHRLAGGERTGEDGEAPGAAHGHQPDVRDDQPLDGAVPVAGDFLGIRSHREKIDTGSALPASGCPPEPRSRPRGCGRAGRKPCLARAVHRANRQPPASRSRPDPGRPAPASPRPPGCPR